MSRYIDDDEALKTIKKMLYETALNNFTTDRKFADDCEEIAEHRLATWVSLVPPADVVNVVRCKDCQHGSTVFDELGNEVALYCEEHEEWKAHMDYCSDGERREDERNK